MSSENFFNIFKLLSPRMENDIENFNRQLVWTVNRSKMFFVGTSLMQWEEEFGGVSRIAGCV